ncbi:MAG: hypothetical protein WB511_01615 [Nitrososphaeraceae archaeon]
MENIQQTEMSKEERIEMLKNKLKETKIFHETHKTRMEVKPNVPYTVLLSKNWHVTPKEDPENWFSRNESRIYDNPKTGKKEMIHDTTYRVRQLQSDDPLFLQELHLGQKSAEIFNKEIERVMVQDPDRDIIIKFTKNVGATQYDVTWDVVCSLA